MCKIIISRDGTFSFPMIRLGVMLVAFSSVLAILASGAWMIHNSSKNLAKGDGTYVGGVALLVAGVLTVLCSGFVNKLVD
jgi:hypothetical protein